MKLTLILYSLGAVAVVFFILYVWIKKIAPKVKARKIEIKEKEKEMQLEKAKELFLAIFKFLPGDGSLRRHEEIFRVHEVINHLHDSFKKYNESLGVLKFLIAEALLIRKLVKDEEIIFFIYTKNVLVLENVDWGLGFSRLRVLENYAELLVLQKSGIFQDSRQVAIALGFESVDRTTYD